MISMNGFLREPEGLRKQELAAVERVLRSGWYILGEEVKSFEAEWARTIGTKHAVGVGNGLDAIDIALRALGVGTGDEVITTPMTAFASVLAVIRAGAQPVLADIDPATALMSMESARRCLGHRRCDSGRWNRVTDSARKTRLAGDRTFAGRDVAGRAGIRGVRRRSGDSLLGQGRAADRAAD